MNVGAAVQCPNNYCGPVALPNPNDPNNPIVSGPYWCGYGGVCGYFPTALMGDAASLSEEDADGSSDSGGWSDYANFFIQTKDIKKKKRRRHKGNVKGRRKLTRNKTEAAPAPAPPPPTNHCILMALMAQNLVSEMVKKYGDSVLDKNSKAFSDAVTEFDDQFSTWYIGMPLRTYEQALSLYRNGPTGEPRREGSPHAYVLGQNGFKSGFKEEMEADQTHHFITYMSGGINSAYWSTGAHWTFDHKNDAALGTAGYKIGVGVRSDPAKFLSIGTTIINEICGN
jgi:hypothetical protein